MISGRNDLQTRGIVNDLENQSPGKRDTYKNKLRISVGKITSDLFTGSFVIGKYIIR